MTYRLDAIAEKEKKTKKNGHILLSELIIMR